MTDVDTHNSPIDTTQLYRQLRWTTLALSLMLVILVVLGIVIWNNEVFPGWVMVAAAAATVPFVVLLHIVQRRRIAHHDGRQPTSEQKLLSRKILFWVGLGAAFQVARLVIQFWARAMDTEVADVLDLVSSAAFIAVTIVALVRIIQIAGALRKIARSPGSDVVDHG